MLIYVPVTNFSPNAPTHDVQEIESTKAVFHKVKDIQYNNSIYYNGYIYNGDSIFKNPDGAYAWWNRDFKAIKENELKAEEINWKNS